MLHQQQDDHVSAWPVSGDDKLLPVLLEMIIFFIILPLVCFNCNQPGKQTEKETGTAPLNINKQAIVYWTPSDIHSITDSIQKELVTYGRELIAHTSRYLGPKGSVKQISNGLNCQNCHLQAGTAVYGNNYGSVASLYPKFRPRSGTIENVYKRVKDCFERSLNGKAPDTTTREMQAILAYINFIGSNVTRGEKAAGSGLKDLSWLDRAADPEKGKTVFITKCQTCHQANGQGLFNAEKTEYLYPALWGENSFNDGAGLFRISNFAKYVKYNMPQGTTHEKPQLKDEEAWDVAAFVLTQNRPHINTPKDWPDKNLKPVDYPFGPYVDSFTEQRHKLGPFKAMLIKNEK